jgi:hypothetical protein
VLERAASLEVRARDALGDVPPGLEALLFADVEPFNLWMCCEEGAEPGLGARDPSGPRTTFHLGREADPARIEALRPGVPLRLLVSDEWGTELGSARELMLAPGELRVEEFEVTQRPRTLLLTVRDSLGLPVRWVTVRAAAAGAPERPRRWLLTDRAGMARVEALYAAEVSLELSRAGFEPRSLGSVRVPPEGAALEVVLAHDWWPW